MLEFTGLFDSAALQVTGEYVSLRRLELKSSDEARKTSTAGDAGDSRGSGLLVDSGLGVRLIHLWIHDFGTSVLQSRPSGLEIYGCLFFDCHGAGLHLRNSAGAPRQRIENNCVFQHGRQGFGRAPSSNVDVVGNAFFNNGIANDGFHRNLILGDVAPGYRDVVIAGNWVYRAPGPILGAEHNSLFGVRGSGGPRVQGNVFCHWGRKALTIDRAEGATVEANTI